MNLKRTAKRALVHLWQDTGLEWLRDGFRAARGDLPAAILLFHRVTDEIPEDPITVSTARFRWILRALRDQYHPMTLAALVACLADRHPLPKRAVVVTFDDGYLDNFSCAAPILAELGVPATFYVVSGAMGSDWVMPWDQQVPMRLPWMTWDHVRQLHRQGFEIGSHTVSHADLGQTRGDAAWREIAESKKRIEDELGADVPSFAYPFGGRKHFLEENRELVRRAGYRSCLTAVAGFVRRQSDPFDLLRFPIHFSYRDRADLDYDLRFLFPGRPPSRNGEGHGY